MKTPFGLYLILTNPVAGYEACAKAAVECGVRYLQLRMKDEPPVERLRVARALREITRGTATCFVVNDDLDLAMAVDADGLHLGQDDASLLDARTKWNVEGKVFGLSTHSLEQAKKALEQSPDYLGVGPVFLTSTKKNAGRALGVKETGRIIRSSPLPCVAIGGINADRLPSLFAENIQNFCVISAVNKALNPSVAIQQLMKNKL